MRVIKRGIHTGGKTDGEDTDENTKAAEYHQLAGAPCLEDGAGLDPAEVGHKDIDPKDSARGAGRIRGEYAV
jgi:hypothetical protein